jgi:Protein of unknown function (DUF3349)
MIMEMPPFLRSIIGWLRAGYPEGVPDVDYIPLFGLLGSQLSDTEVGAIGDELASSADPDSAEAIRAAIKTATHDPASDSDMARVRARLAAGGWPLAAPKREQS